VRHTNDNVLDTVVDTAVNEGLHAGHQGLTTLQTETLVVRELGGKEGLEAGTPDQTVEDTALVVNRVVVGLGDFETVTDPLARLAVGDVDVLDTVGAAVDLLAGSNDLAQGHLLTLLGQEARQDTGSKGELLVEVALSETVVVELELLGLAVAESLDVATDAERIDLGLVVTTGLVGADKKLDLQVVCDVRASAQASAGHILGDTAGRGRDKGRGRSEGLGHGHVAILHVPEIGLPRDVDTGRIPLPGQVHLVNVVGSVA